LTAEDFASLKATNATDSADIEKQITALESEKNMMGELIEQSRQELIDLVRAWSKTGITGRVELQKALFPDGLVWSHESGFLNSENTRLMDDWREYFQSLGDSRADLNNFLVLFGVPPVQILNPESLQRLLQLRAFLLRLHYTNSGVERCAG
jgi:hypothetical protein